MKMAISAHLKFEVLSLFPKSDSLSINQKMMWKTFAIVLIW